MLISRISPKVIFTGRPSGRVEVTRLIGRGIPPRMPGLAPRQIVDSRWVGTAPRYCRSWVWRMNNVSRAAAFQPASV